MKRKNLKWVICALFIVVAVTGMLIFALGGKREDYATNEIQLDGMWLIVSDVNDGKLTLTDNEYIVFDRKRQNYPCIKSPAGLCMGLPVV